MKKLVFAPLVLAFAANTALAANSVDLRVTGTITPAACDISLAGGDFDLGTISAQDLNATTETDLGSSTTKQLNIVCSGATQVAFKAIDNRASSRPSGVTGTSSIFGMGMDSANNPIGYYKIFSWPANAVANGSPAVFRHSNDEGATWTEAAKDASVSFVAYDIQQRIYAIDPTSGGTGQPTPITSASAIIQVRPIIQPENTLDTSSEITIDGSATIELVYL